MNSYNMARKRFSIILTTDHSLCWLQNLLHPYLFLDYLSLNNHGPTAMIRTLKVTSICADLDNGLSHKLVLHSIPQKKEKWNLSTIIQNNSFRVSDSSSWFRILVFWLFVQKVSSSQSSSSHQTAKYWAGIWTMKLSDTLIKNTK